MKPLTAPFCKVPRLGYQQSNPGAHPGAGAQMTGTLSTVWFDSTHRGDNQLTGEVGEERLEKGESDIPNHG